MSSSSNRGSSSTRKRAHGSSSSGSRSNRSPQERRFINRSKPVGAGLLNLGNTCFLNSVLQALSHCDFLINAIDSSHHSEHCAGAAEGCVLCAFERHIRIARSMTDPIAPEQIVQCLPTISSTLTLGEQEDAHEFLRCTVDALQRSVPPEITKRKEEYPFSLFAGSVKNIVKCMKCKKVSSRIDPVEDLELEISKARNLQVALSNFTSNEMMTGDNKYYCENCRAKTEAQRCLSLNEIPPVLSIQLKRFTYTGRKLKHFVEYPLSLDFSRYMSAQGKSSKGASASRASSKASLFAIVVHHGYSISNGHYVCYINTSHGWFKMDDASVKTCTEEEAMKQNAYLLFYQKNDKKNKFYRSHTISEIAVHIVRAASPINCSPAESGALASSSSVEMNPPLSKRNRSGSDLFAGSIITAAENNANLVNKTIPSANVGGKKSNMADKTDAKKVTVVKKRKLSNEPAKDVKVTRAGSGSGGSDGSRGSSKSIIQSISDRILRHDSYRETKTKKAKGNVKRVTIRAKRRPSEQSEMDADYDGEIDTELLDENEDGDDGGSRDERVEWIPWMGMGSSRNSNKSQSSSADNAPAPKPKRGVFGWVNHWLGSSSSSSGGGRIDG